MLEVSVVKEYIGLNSLYLLYFCMFLYQFTKLQPHMASGISNPKMKIFHTSKAIQ